MTTLREAAQQALEALEEFGTHYEHCPRYPTWARPELQPPCNCGLDSNVAALRDALAQEEQEPLLVVEQEPDYMSRGHFYEGSKPFIDPTEVWKLPIGTKLYTHPPRREWQGLTSEEREQATGWSVEHIEAKLKEKNNG